MWRCKASGTIDMACLDARLSQSVTIASWIGFALLLPFFIYLLYQQCMIQSRDERSYKNAALLALAFACLIACLAFLTIGERAGLSFLRCSDGRTVFVPRYISWMFSVPLQLYCICRVGNASHETFLLLVGYSVLMVTSGAAGTAFELFSAAMRAVMMAGSAMNGGQRWSMWGLGMLMLMLIMEQLYHLGVELRNFQNRIQLTQLQMANIGEKPQASSIQ